MATTTISGCFAGYATLQAHPGHRQEEPVHGHHFAFEDLRPKNLPLHRYAPCGFRDDRWPRRLRGRGDAHHRARGRRQRIEQAQVLDAQGYLLRGRARTCHDETMIEIQGRLARADGVDAALIIALDRQTHEIPLLDRRFGAATILDRISAHINMVHELMTHTILTKDRQALARIIADAAAIADWQASISVTTGTYVDVIEQVQRAAVSGMDSLLSPAR